VWRSLLNHMIHDSDRVSDPPGPKARRLFSRWWAEALSALLLLIMALNMLSVIARKGFTVDEAIHIPAGYLHLVAGDFQVNNEHPPLIKMWAALPLLFIQPDEPSLQPRANEDSAARTRAMQSFWQQNRARYESICFWPRVMMILLTLGLGALIFFGGRKLLGAAAAVIAVALFTLEPTVLAHGHVVHTDIASAFAYLLFFVALQVYTEMQTFGRALLLALATSIAVLTKFSMLVVIPVLIVTAILFCVRSPRTRKKRIVIHASVIALFVIVAVNAAYRLQHPALEVSDVRWVEMKSASNFATITTGIRIAAKIIPTYYLFGAYNIGIHNAYGHQASLLGMYSERGWWYYFPVAFALKTTIPFLLISVAAVGWAAWRASKHRETQFWFCLAPLALYTALAMSSHINIGIRHYLPAYPFLFILGGGLLARLFTSKRTIIRFVLVTIVFGWMLFEVTRTLPDYLTYMNQFASSHPHWWYLSDSNVEWGEDNKQLADYLRARGETQVSAAVLGGTLALPQYGIEYVDLLGPNVSCDNPPTRYVAIGASFLNGSTISPDDAIPGRKTGENQNYFAAYRNRTPEAIFGNSIYLYREALDGNQ
jgi:dolichyl-phosphate-mannose-protein mannosyltransferase